MLVSDNGASRRGRSERLGERDEVHQRHPRRHRGQPADARRPRQPEDLQPLSERLGDGVQHAVQDVEALRVQRRHQRPVHHLLAGRHEGARRDPRPVPPRDRHRARRSSTRSASSRRRRSRATCRASSTASACATASTMPRRRRHARRSSTRCSARGRSGTTAGRRSRPTRRSPAGATSTTTSGSCTTPTSTDPSCTTSPPSSPDKLRELVEPLVSPRPARTARSRSTTARRSRSSLTPRPVLTPPRNRYVYFPDTAEVPESQAVNIRNRSYAIGALVDIPAAGRRGRPVRTRLAIRRARPVRQGQPAALRLQLRRDARADVVGSEDVPTGENLILSAVVRQGRARIRPASPTACCRSYHGDDEGRRGHDQDPAGQVRDRRRGAVRRPRRRRPASPTTTPASDAWRFTGGTIHRVAVDVSGEPYVDLEREAEAHADARVVEATRATRR